VIKMLILALFFVACGSDDTSNVEHLNFQKDSKSVRFGANMTYHGGPVMHTVATASIFWGAEWSNSNFAGDKITGLDSFFSGAIGSRYGSTGSEYGDMTGNTGNVASYQGHTFDPKAAPTKALTSLTAVAEVCAITGNAPNPSTVYFIYTSTPAGVVNYCAWHSWGKCSNGAPVLVAYMPNVDSVAGCSANDLISGHSKGLAALANVTAHELLETMTDPVGSAWYDSSGNENGDKCAWSFPPTLSTFTNGSKWKLQMEWSNAAFTAGTGLPNGSGQKGCIY